MRQYNAYSGEDMAKTQDYGLGEFTFPRGWFMVAGADELTDGAVLSVRFFGTDFVIYRGQSGRVVMLEAYCAHMGTHLGKNTSSYVVHDGTRIQGDSIRCPYHAWRFGPDGKCDDIPYSKHIPKAACVKAWPVVEKLGIIFVWHDPENGEPDFQIPVVPEWDEPSWVQWKIDHMGQLACHSQEVLDNMADLPHLGPVHGSTVEYFENEFRGTTYVQRQGGGHRTLVTKTGMLETDTWYTGPGILMSRMTGMVDSLMFITNTPVDDGVIQVWHGLLVKSPSAVATPEDVTTARAYQEDSRRAFAQDFEIWGNKRPAFNILQIPTDGPFAKGRIWYRQFYNPRHRAHEFQKQVEGIHTVPGMPTAPRRAETYEIA